MLGFFEKVAQTSKGCRSECAQRNRRRPVHGHSVFSGRKGVALLGVCALMVGKFQGSGSGNVSIVRVLCVRDRAKTTPKIKIGLACYRSAEPPNFEKCSARCLGKCHAEVECLGRCSGRCLGVCSGKCSSVSFSLCSLLEKKEKDERFPEHAPKHLPSTLRSTSPSPPLRRGTSPGTSPSTFRGWAGFGTSAAGQAACNTKQGLVWDVPLTSPAQ